MFVLSEGEEEEGWEGKDGTVGKTKGRWWNGGDIERRRVGRGEDVKDRGVP